MAVAAQINSASLHTHANYIYANTPQEIIRVLVVEDDRNLREALTDTLQLAGYEVIAKSSAEDALFYLSDHQDIRMIVSDVNMGSMSGHDLLREDQICGVTRCHR